MLVSSVHLRCESKTAKSEGGEGYGTKRTTLEGNMFCTCVTRILKAAERRERMFSISSSPQKKKKETEESWWENAQKDYIVYVYDFLVSVLLNLMMWLHHIWKMEISRHFHLSCLPACLPAWLLVWAKLWMLSYSRMPSTAEVIGLHHANALALKLFIIFHPILILDKEHAKLEKQIDLIIYLVEYLAVPIFRWTLHRSQYCDVHRV